LPELIVTDVDGYVRKAVALARDANERQRLRAFLDAAGHDSPLFDTVATTRALEAAYGAMAAQYRNRTRAPIDIDVAPAA